MNERLLQFIKAENISQSQLADNIGVARAAVSHVIAGRNKPSFDFIEGLSRRYPALSMEWLIAGTGKMYKTGAVSGSLDSIPSMIEGDLFSTPLPDPAQEVQTVAAGRPTSTSSPYSSTSTPLSASAPLSASSPLSSSSTPLSQTVYPSSQQSFSRPQDGKRISKILVFYTDGTFQELN